MPDWRQVVQSSRSKVGRGRRRRRRYSVKQGSLALNVSDSEDSRVESQPCTATLIIQTSYSTSRINLDSSIQQHVNKSEFRKGGRDNNLSSVNIYISASLRSNQENICTQVPINWRKRRTLPLDVMSKLERSFVSFTCYRRARQPRRCAPLSLHGHCSGL